MERPAFAILCNDIIWVAAVNLHNELVNAESFLSRTAVDLENLFKLLTPMIQFIIWFWK